MSALHADLIGLLKTPRLPFTWSAELYSSQTRKDQPDKQLLSLHAQALDIFVKHCPSGYPGATQLVLVMLKCQMTNDSCLKDVPEDWEALDLGERASNAARGWGVMLRHLGKLKSKTNEDSSMHPDIVRLMNNMCPPKRKESSAVSGDSTGTLKAAVTAATRQLLHVDQPHHSQEQQQQLEAEAVNMEAKLKGYHFPTFGTESEASEDDDSGEDEAGSNASSDRVEVVKVNSCGCLKCETCKAQIGASSDEAPAAHVRPGVRDNQRKQVAARRKELEDERKAASNLKKAEAQAKKDAKHAKQTGVKTPPAPKKPRTGTKSPAKRPAKAPTSDDDATDAEDEGGEEEETVHDEFSEPTPVKRPAAAKVAPMRRPSATTDAATVTLPVYIHTRYTEGAEGQYILDAKKMSVVACSKKQCKDYKLLITEIKKELEPNRLGTKAAAGARLEQMILANA